MMQQVHALQLLFCEALESIADGLPNNVPAGLMQSALELLESGALNHLRTQEQALFSALSGSIASTRHLRFVIDRLAAEHADDWSAALEIAHELRLLAKHGRARNPEMLGFMLRAYFEAQRRHVEWEAGVLLPLVRELLTAADLRELQHQLTSGHLSNNMLQ